MVIHWLCISTLRAQSHSHKSVAGKTIDFLCYAHLLNAARHVFLASFRLKSSNILNFKREGRSHTAHQCHTQPRQPIGSSKRRALLLFFNIVNPKPTLFWGFFLLLLIPQHKSATSSWIHFVNEVLSPGCARRLAPQAHRVVFPGAFLPRRFWSSCAFTSRVWRDRALMQHHFKTTTLSILVYNCTCTSMHLRHIWIWICQH